MSRSGKSIATCERRFDTSLAVFKERCTISWKLARETGSEKSGWPFFAVRRQHLSGNLFVEPSPLRWLLPQMNEGWVKLHRSLQDHPRANNPHWMCLWIHLLLLATHKPIRMVFAGKILDLKPGQFITSRLSLSAKTGLHRSMIDRLLQTMIFEHQIEQQTSNVSRLITILNWDKYQQIEPRIEHQLSHDRATGEQPASTNKNVKNGRMEEEPPKSPNGGIGELFPVELSVPTQLKTDEFLTAWGNWMEHRRSMKKPKDWMVFFQRQLNWLGSLPYAQALDSVTMSCRNGYQGLIEARNGHAAAPSSKRNEGMTNKVTTESGNMIAEAARRTRLQPNAK